MFTSRLWSCRWSINPSSRNLKRLPSWVLKEFFTASVSVNGLMSFLCDPSLQSRPKIIACRAGRAANNFRREKFSSQDEKRQPVRIGKQDNAVTAIATSDDHSITVRGHDLVGDLIEQIDFTDHFRLLVCGTRPTDTQKAMMNACLVAICEHGLVPSVQAARMTLAAAPEAWQGAMAAGLLGMGSVVAGSSELAGRYIAEVVAEGGDEPAAIASLERQKAARRKVSGLGHPQHAAGDPRADKLLDIADRLGVSGPHVAALRHLGAFAPGIMDRPLPINVSGAIPAVILDAGWPIGALKAVPLRAHAGGLAAHLYEESRRPIGFVLSHNADLAISYGGDAAA